MLTTAVGQPVRTANQPVIFDIPQRADATPSVAALRSFVAVAWGASSAGKADVFVAVSRDGGASFATPVQVNTIDGEARLGGELPPRLALRPQEDGRDPEIAVLWTARTTTTAIKAARSVDGGRSYGAPITLQSQDALGDRGWAALAFDRESNLHAIWLDHRGMAANRPANGAAHEPGEHDGVAMAQRSALYHASTGRTLPWEQELTKGVCYCCKTALAVGPDGALHAAWRHVYAGNLRDMAFATSRDNGRTFSAPVRVNEDGWAINGCPDDGPALAVDARGTVHMAWPTVIPGENPEGAIFYTSTRDGQRFAPRVRVPTLGGPKPSHPQIVIDHSGRVFVAWDENVDGRRTGGVREVRPAANGESAFGPIAILAPGDVALYPVLAATDKGLVAVWTTGGEHAQVLARVLPQP
jgi:hypothetical protein